MARERYYNTGTTADYAKLHGISVKTARKRLALEPTATKTGRGWRVPILSTQYAKIRGITPDKARKTGTRGLPTPTKTVTTKVVTAAEVARHIASLAAKRTSGSDSPINESGIRDRAKRMTPEQRRKAADLRSYSDLIDEIDNPDFELDDEGGNALWYH